MMQAMDQAPFGVENGTLYRLPEPGDEAAGESRTS
jgi:hypothetical protein